MTSKIKVDNIADQDDNNIINESGDVITVGAAGDTVAVAGNIVKSNAYQASDGGNIVSQSGTTVTLGASGDTVTLASGASQSGFGRTGTVDWQTGDIKTGNFTAANGKGYFVNTTGGAITATLPSSPSAGNIVAIADYAGTAATNNITIGRGGSNIEGVAIDGIISANRDTITLVYVDGTQGWLAVNDNESSFLSPEYVTATGGTITTSGNFKIHTFTGPGTFTVSCAGNTVGSNSVDYLVVAGGGGGGGSNFPGGGAGGGGAGGYRESGGTASGCYTVSPLGSSPSSVAAITVTAQGYPITVGGGGPGAPSSVGNAGNGNNSVFSTITSTAGGFGGSPSSPTIPGQPGGSGGGGPWQSRPSNVGTGNTPPVSPPQGNPGASGSGNPGYAGGGGGGALAAGTAAPQPGGKCGGAGGGGATSSINATPTARAGGGGGGAGEPAGTGGTASGGGGPGGNGDNGAGNNATANLGGGGGAGAGGGASGGGNGGSGVVIIRYQFQGS
jgi:hypothetical protein